MKLLSFSRRWKRSCPVFGDLHVNKAAKGGTNRRRIGFAPNFPLCSRLDVVRIRWASDKPTNQTNLKPRPFTAGVNFSVPRRHRCHPPGHCQNKTGRRSSPFDRGPRMLCDQTIYWPPLADIVDPVMNPDSSEARNTTQRAISSGSPRRPAGIWATIVSSTFSGTARTISVPI
jgi:hypothetical protein